MTASEKDSSNGPLTSDILIDFNHYFPYIYIHTHTSQSIYENVQHKGIDDLYGPVLNHYRQKVDVHDWVTAGRTPTHISHDELSNKIYTQPKGDQSHISSCFLDNVFYVTHASSSKMSCTNSKLTW